MKNDMLLNKIIIFCIYAYFVILIEIATFQLLAIAYPIILIWGFLAFEIFLAILFYTLGCFLFKSFRVILLFSFLMFLISFSGLSFLLIVQKYAIIELIPLLILLGLIALYFIFKLHKSSFGPLKIGILAGIATAFIIFIILTYSKPFLFTKIELLCLCTGSFLSLKFSYYHLEYKRPKKPKNLIQKYMKYGLIGLFLFSTITLFGSVNYIEIEANNSPEIIFWSSAKETPRDESTLQYCYENDIGFCVVLREHYISDGGASEKRRIEYLLNHSIITYICLGGGDDEFYLTSDNGDEFYEIFRTIRTWLKINNLYNYKCLRSFVVDAEIPKFYHNDLKNYDSVQKARYLVNQVPSENKLKKIKENLKDMIDEIHDDEKKVGIIKLPTMFDRLDGDGDYDYVSNTIYSLSFPWDFSVSMNYRTQHVPQVSDYLIEDMSQYDYTNDYEMSYTQLDQLEKSLVPLSTFYQEVTYEIYHSDVNVKQSRRYIFIGVFTPKFEDTSYIKFEEYKKDLDVCRHFGVSKVWIYEWSGWDRFYSLKDLVKYNRKPSKWILIIPNYIITRELFNVLGIITMDKLLFVK